MRRILFTETDFNALPNPPAGFKYIGFDGPNFTAKDETGISVPTGAAGVVDVTHSNLLDMISTSDLTPGTYYKITDFKTCYDQPDYLFGEDIMYTDIPMNGTQSLYPQYKTGATHSIIVFALDVDKLAPDAYQPDFPKDQIKYDVTWNTTEINEEIAYGRITERIDEFGNRTDYDHREVVFKRYPQYSYKLGEHLLSGNIQIFEDGTIIGTNSFFLDLSVDDVIAVPDTWQKLFKITSIADDYTMSVTGSFIPQTGAVYNLYSTTKDGYFRYAKNNIDDGDYLEFPVFDGNSKRNYFGNKSTDLTINLDFLLSNNVFLGTFSGNTFGEFCMNNTITSDQFVLNNIGDAFYGNNITSTFWANNIGDLCNNNIIHTPFHENNIGTQFSQNEIGIFKVWSGEFNNNIIANSFKGNLINGGNFDENNIGFGFSYNEVLGSFFNNNIESYFIGNNTSYEFTNNKIDSFFTGNNISHNFGFNEIAKSFSSNNIANDFGYGGGYSRANKIGNNFENNNIGEYFYDNTIADLFTNNTISNYFQFNDVKSQNLNSVDFTTYNGNILSFSYSFVGGGNSLPNEVVGTTFSNVSGTYSYGGSTTSIVVDATFDIFVLTQGAVIVTLNEPGKFYLPAIGFTSSTIKISGTKIGGVDVSTDVNISINEVSDLPSVYAEYNTEIFKRAGGVNRLSYYDASDVLTITDIDK